jgi:hypothetical protein
MLVYLYSLSFEILSMQLGGGGGVSVDRTPFKELKHNINQDLPSCERPKPLK